MIIGVAALLTNHALALLRIAEEPGIRLRDVAACLDVTERAAHRIVCDLEEAGYLTRHRVGRRNHYEVHAEGPVGDPIAGEPPVGELLAPLLAAKASAA